MAENPEKILPGPDFIRTQFAVWNERIFGSKLPTPRFRIYPAKSYNGLFRVISVRQGSQQLKVPEITLSSARKRTADELTDTLIHEMIHMHIHCSGIKETAHGPSFRKLMDLINSRFGRNIRISERHAESDQEISIPTFKILCVCRMACDGKLAVCTPARTQVFNMNRAFLARKDVTEVSWYLVVTSALDPYPLSRKPNLYRIDQQLLQDILSDADRYRIANGRFLPF